MNAYNQYKNNQVLNASPEQILIMLYDGAIRFNRQAMAAIDDNDFKMMAEKISRVMAIVSEFSMTLDMEVGGSIAEELDALYAFVIRELTKANLKKSKESLQVVENILQDLREGFVGAIEENRKNAVTSQPAAGDQRVALSY